MFNKFTHSQSTIVSVLRQPRSLSTHRDHQTAMKNPFRERLPIKFPQKRIVKPCEQHMLQTTTQNPQKSCLRVYPQHNRSRFFQDTPLPLTQTEILSRHPQHLFDTYQQRKLSNPGYFHHLSQQSYELPIRMRTYEDIGATHNEKRIFSKMHYKADPIIVGEPETQFNSALNNVWKQPRRHRDNGLECQKVLQSTTYLRKREPYGQRNEKGGSYAQNYLKSRNMKKK